MLGKAVDLHSDFIILMFILTSSSTNEFMFWSISISFSVKINNFNK